MSIDSKKDLTAAYNIYGVKYNKYGTCWINGEFIGHICIRNKLPTFIPPKEEYNTANLPRFSSPTKAELKEKIESYFAPQAA